MNKKHNISFSQIQPSYFIAFGVLILILLVSVLFSRIIQNQNTSSSTRADEGGSSYPPLNVWLEGGGTAEWHVYATGETNEKQYVAFYVKLGNDPDHLGNGSIMGFRNILFDREGENGIEGQDLTDLAVIQEGDDKGKYQGIARMSYNKAGEYIRRDSRTRLFTVIGEKPIIEAAFLYEVAIEGDPEDYRSFKGIKEVRLNRADGGVQPDQEPEDQPPDELPTQSLSDTEMSQDEESCRADSETCWDATDNKCYRLGVYKGAYCEEQIGCIRSFTAQDKTLEGSCKDSYRDLEEGRTLISCSSSSYCAQVCNAEGCTENGQPQDQPADESGETDESEQETTNPLVDPDADVKEIICYTHEHCRDHGYETCKGSCSSARPGTCVGGSADGPKSHIPSNEIDRITQGYEPCTCDRYGSRVDSSPVPPSCPGGNKSGGENGSSGDDCPEGKECGPVVTRCACDGKDGRDPADRCGDCPDGYNWCHGGICVRKDK